MLASNCFRVVGDLVVSVDFVHQLTLIFPSKNLSFAGAATVVGTSELETMVARAECWLTTTTMAAPKEVSIGAVVA